MCKCECKCNKSKYNWNLNNKRALLFGAVLAKNGCDCEVIP